MKLGLYIFPSEQTIDPAVLAAEAEGDGFESLFFPDHTHIPVSRETPWPYGDEELFRSMYLHMYDPLIALATAVSVTERIRLGTAIALVTERDPILTAKSVATLDTLSKGRIDLGIGPGWNDEELLNHGGDPKRRLRSMRERVESMKEIWRSDEAEYHGEIVNFDPIWSWPKPYRETPPILVGGGFPGAVRRALNYADGWMPTASSHDVAALMPQVRQMCEEAGRDPDTFNVTVCGALDDEAELDRYREAGVSRALFMMWPLPHDAALEQLGEYAKHL